MADETTPRLNLVKPEVGGSADTWGDKWNENADKIDAAIIKPDEENVWSAPQRFEGGLYAGTTSPTDTTEGRVLKVGDFGVGQTIWINPGENLNDFTTPGEYHQATNAYATPELNYPAQLAGSLKVMRAASGVVQEYTTYGNTRRKFLRGLYNGSWSGWVEFYHTGNIANLDPGTQIMWDTPAGDRLGVVVNNPAGSSSIFFGDPNSADIRVYGPSDASYPSTILAMVDGAFQAKIANDGVVIGYASSPTFGHGTLNAINGLYDGGRRVLPIGVGQIWKFLTAQRTVGTTYTNTTGRTIFVSVAEVFNNEPSDLLLYVDSTVVSRFRADGGNGLSVRSFVSGVVPPGSTYRVESNKEIASWMELRE